MKFQKIKPYLWFDNSAQEASKFYCSIFNNSKIISDSEMLVEFQLEGINFLALNGGPKFKFNESVSLFVSCENQLEVDYLWNKLISGGGSEGRCGWCKDKFGLSWQIIPKRFIEMMETGNAEQTRRILQVMMEMNKMVIEKFEIAFKK